jgi:DNA-binding LacI/PurR family transcriptional regulator
LAKHSNSLDVARLAGVSQTTVSFVLNQRAGQSISSETRDRVLDAARKLQYRPNRLSNGLFRGATGLVGVVMPLITDDYYAHILSSISSCCAQTGKTVVFSPLQGDHANKRDPLLRLIEYRVDGIILVCQQEIAADISQWLTELVDKRIRCVVVDDRKHESEVNCIVSNDIVGAGKVVEYLASLGHRRIAHISAGTESSTSVDRNAGFVQGMASLGIDKSDLLIEGSSYAADAGRIAAKKVLDNIDRPTAIFAGNDTLAAEVLIELRSRGLRCPQDISVVGYGNTSVARALELTSVDQHPITIGKAAMESLFGHSEDDQNQRDTDVVDCELVKRNSCSPIGKGEFS